jgi:hypothetical protein
MGAMMLAQYSLLGNARGTLGGIAGGAIGGATIGFGIGGPLGAAIGGAAGGLIGVGELLAGVEPPFREAERLVRSQYHISINRTTADHIVALAQSSYGGRVSVAVRSPEVRQMLGLYAAGTGQANSFPASANAPHGGSLIESGGSLFQGASYQYGNAYAYQSNLPVYGGGSPGLLPNPGNNGLMVFNIEGGSVNKFLDGGVFSPSAVSGKYASAMNASAGRADQAMNFSEPGSIVV